MTELTVAALQLAFTDDIDENIAQRLRTGARGGRQGRQVCCRPNCSKATISAATEDEGLFASAKPVGEHPAVLAMRKLAAELEIYIPTSFFEARRAASL